MRIKELKEWQLADYVIFLMDDFNDNFIEEMDSIMAENAFESDVEYTSIEDEEDMELEVKVNLTDLSMELFDTRDGRSIIQYDNKVLNPVTAMVRIFLRRHLKDMPVAEEGLEVLKGFNQKYCPWEPKLGAYRTNAKCNRCGESLYTFDYLGDYPLVCQGCEEDFYFWETAVETPHSEFYVWIPAAPLNWNTMQSYLTINKIVSALDIGAKTTYDHMRECLRIDLLNVKIISTKEFQGLLLWVTALLADEEL